MAWISWIVGGFRGRAEGAAAPPPFPLIYSQNHCYQLPCAIRVVLWVWGKVELSPKLFLPPLSAFSGSTPKDQQSWTKVVQTNKYHTFFANVLAYKRVNNIYPHSPRSMLFPGVCKFTRLCFDHVTTLTTLKWGRGVEKISYGTLNKWKFGKVSQEFCPRLSEERNV